MPAASDGDGILWQVQTTFLSVGFAGLAITAQLFAEAPLAIGASRGRVLEYIRAGWFVGVGLVANATIALETIWLPSALGILGVTFVWFALTVAFLVVSTVRLMQLFGHPSLLDEVVKVSLVETLSSRLDAVASRYADARRELDGLVASAPPFGHFNASAVAVPVPQVGLVVKAIKPNVLKRALATLEPRVTEDASTTEEDADLYSPPEIELSVEPGDRTRLGQVAFRVSTTQELDDAAQAKLIRLLQSSIVFEASGSVTPDEETDREIANLKDTIGTNLRTGAFATAERALELLAQIVRGVWMAQLGTLDASRRTSFTRRDWLFRSIGDVEQDALYSPRAAGIFVDQAMTRALEAPRTGSTDYVDVCLRSFTTIWFDILRHGGPEFDSVWPRITTCVQNLAAFAYAPADEREDLRARATWAMVDLVKLALDARRPEAARLAAEELDGLFEYAERHGSARGHVRAGQLVLSGWLEFLAAKKDERDPVDPNLRKLVAARGTWEEILAARVLAERGAAPFSRWDWWEMKTSGRGRAQVLELSNYVDLAELSALVISYGTLPRADDQETVSEYRRFVALLDENGRALTASEVDLKQRFLAEIDRWESAEDSRLADEPISSRRVGELTTALVETLSADPRLADQIPVAGEAPVSAERAEPILGMNFRVPRHYLVDEIFNQTLADPKELGQVIARGFTDGEDRKIVEVLRSIQEELLEPSVRAILEAINALDEASESYVLLTPYGGLMDVEQWYSVEFREALTRVVHIESAMLDEEAILFDPRTTLAADRRPEEKQGLVPVDGTSIALGVFEDVHDGAEPQVRIETGEYFVVWPGDDPHVVRFGINPSDEE